MDKNLQKQVLNYTDSPEDVIREKLQDRICDISALIEDLQVKKFCYQCELLGVKWQKNIDPKKMIIEKVEMKHREELSKAISEAVTLYADINNITKGE